VGFGDYGPKSALEMIFCIIIMLFGEISFSFASGQFASILENTDEKIAEFDRKIFMLNRIYQQYHLPLDLFNKIK